MPQRKTRDAQRPEQQEPPQALAPLPRLYGRFGATDADSMIAAWRSLLRRCGLEDSLAALGLDPTCADGVASNVNTERLGNNPVPCSAETIRSAVLAQLFDA